MVRPTKKGILKVDDIAPHVDRHNLAAAITGDLVAVGEPGKQQARMNRLFTVPHNILRGPELSNLMRQTQHRLFVGLVQRHPQLKFAEHWKQRSAGIVSIVARSARPDVRESGTGRHCSTITASPNNTVARTSPASFS